MISDNTIMLRVLDNAAFSKTLLQFRTIKDRDTGLLLAMESFVKELRDFLQYPGREWDRQEQGKGP